jgi:hypothetical protein
MIRSPLFSLILLAGCSTDKSIAVRNTAPAATITSPIEGVNYLATDVIEFKAVVSDAQTPNDELFISWDTDKDGLLTDAALADSDGFTTFSVADLSPGETHVVTLRVVDGGGKSATDSIVITVSDDDVVIVDEPMVNVLAPHPSGSDSPWEADVRFQFEAQVRDDQDPANLIIVTVSLVDADGLELEELCSTVATIASDTDEFGYAICEGSMSPGNHIIGFKAIDTEGFVGTAVSDLKVISGDQIDNDGDGFTEIEGDCDDTDEDVFPGAYELINEVDDDCNGHIDDGTMAYDDDGDGYSEYEGDCNDEDPLVSPTATELCDGIDNDCNTLIDGEDAVDGTTYYRDLDGDSFGDWSASITACEPVSGYTADATDCNDTDADAHPGATEICDGVDNDCNGFSDDEGALGCTTWYLDADEDGYGTSVSVCTCSATGDYTATLSSDCYDANPDANPTHTSFHTANRGDGSYDYNCDDAEQKKDTATSDSCAFFSDIGCSSPDGWASSPPSCGSTGTWRVGCHYEWDFFDSGCYWSTESSLTQACL